MQSGYSPCPSLTWKINVKKGVMGLGIPSASPCPIAQSSINLLNWIISLTCLYILARKGMLMKKKKKRKRFYGGIRNLLKAYLMTWTFWSYLDVPDELGDAKKNPLKNCMWIEVRDSISFIFDREQKNREIENWIQEDDLRYLTSIFKQDWHAKLLLFQCLANRQLWRHSLLDISPTWQRTRTGINYVYHIFENWSIGLW